MTKQIFKRANNEEGFIAVIAHRERDFDALRLLGWFDTAEESLQSDEIVAVNSPDLELEQAKNAQLTDELGLAHIKNQELLEQLEAATAPAKKGSK